MPKTIVQEYTAVNLLAAQTLAGTVTGSAVDVETYLDDAMVVASIPNTSSGNAGIIVTVTGSLTATPSTYDQTLATFATTGGSAFGIGAKQLNLSGIKNIKGVATHSGSTVAAVAVVALVRDQVKSASDNSGTLA